MKKILISSMNGPIAIELISYLKKKFYIIGCDRQSFGLGKKICDEFYISPNGNSVKFINFLNKIGKKVDQIFLFADEELLNVSINRKKLKNVINKILISPHKTIHLCNNKDLLKKFLKKELYKPISENNKVIIKPKIGRGSKNQIILNDKKNNFYNFFSKKNEFIIEKFIDGKEFTVDCVFDKKNTLIFALPRERIIKSNLSIVGKISKNQKILNYINNLSTKLNFIGNVNIQVILDKKKNIHLIDINPRVSGSIIFSIMAGFDPFLMAYSINNNLKINMPTKIKYDEIFYRYWKTYNKY